VFLPFVSAYKFKSGRFKSFGVLVEMNSEEARGLLGIPYGADSGEVKKAYRLKSLQNHPDKCPGDNQASLRFSRVTEAYRVLLANETLQKEASVQEPTGSVGGQNSVPSPALMAYIDEVVELSMTECYEGKEVPLSIERRVEQRDHLSGEVVIRTERETVYASVPPGIDHDEILVIPSRGHVSLDRRTGDVRIRIKVNNDTPFERRGLDLIIRQDITLLQALTGVDFRVRHVSNKTCRLRTNEEIVTPGVERRIPGWGMRRGDMTGNMIVRFNIVFPQTLSTEQKDALKRTLE